MIKKLAVVLMLVIFGLTGYAEAGKDYRSELEKSKKELAELKTNIAVKKTKLQELTKEFNKSDIALRQDLITCKKDMDEKTYIREAKRRQETLKQDYSAKRKPVKAEYDKMKASYRKCGKRIKTLEKKIDRLADDPEMELYNQKIDDLKAGIQDAKDNLNKKIEALYGDADNKIAQIKDMANKSKIRNQILSDAKVKELALRKTYKEEKQAIVEKMDKVKSDYRKNLAEYRAQRTESERSEVKGLEVEKSSRKKENPKKSAPSTNFGTTR